MKDGLFRLESKGGKTKVFNIETGEELPNCVSARFIHEGGNIPVLEITQRDYMPEIMIDGKERDVKYIKGDGTLGIHFREFI